jgi:hypothetical protein
VRGDGQRCLQMPAEEIVGLVGQVDLSPYGKIVFIDLDIDMVRR